MKSRTPEFLETFFEFVRNGIRVEDLREMIKFILKKLKEKFFLEDVNLKYFSAEANIEFKLKNSKYDEIPLPPKRRKFHKSFEEKKCKSGYRYTFLIDVDETTKAVLRIKRRKKLTKIEKDHLKNIIPIIFTYFLKLYKAEKLALIDELTGLYNHKYLMQYLEKEVEKAERYNDRFSVIFIDLDGLKRVNDAYGHIYGAKTLKEVGYILKRYVRSSDIVARFGGDEFVVIVFKSSVESAKKIAHRLREKIKEYNFLSEEGFNLKLSASFGIACFPEHGKTAEELIKRADEAMYYVKKHGKDGVAVIDELQKEENNGNT